ncbi:Topoisomerase 1-associated factor 1 [Friedmanniomyces endolithicus]|nr:Topoisomerase 1-associated factor 1 [Friedmanniomyces endolithicus]
MLTVGSGAEDEFQEQDVILLEILFHLLKGVDAKKLFMEQQQMQHEETDELRTLMRKEKDMHKSYNRHASSRHNRFGSMLWVKRDGQKMSTVTGQASIVDGDATLLHMDHSKRWNKPKYRGKQTAPMSEQADFGEKVDLDEIARRRLRVFAERSSGRHHVSVRVTSDNTSPADDDDDDANDSASGPEFPPNLREPRKLSADDSAADRPAKRRRLTQRNAPELTDAQVEARAEERRRKEKERNGRIKSALFVEAGFDEESDAEGDREFFRLEEERRGRIAGVNGGVVVGRKAAKHGEREGEKDGSGETRKIGDESEDEDLDVDEGQDEDDPEGDAIDDEIDEWIGRKRKRPAMFEEDSEDEREILPKIPAVDRRRGAHPDFAFGAPGERLGSEGEREEEEEEEEGGDEETPLTSPMEIEDEIQKPNKEGGVLPLMEFSENLVGGTMKSGAMGSKAVVRDDEDEDEDEDDVPFARRMATARRSVRAGFIVDSDSE